MTDERRAQLQKIIDHLRGSTGNLEETYREETSIHFDNAPARDLHFIDEQIFNCEVCGWWCGTDEMAEDKDMVCDECADD